MVYYTIASTTTPLLSCLPMVEELTAYGVATGLFGKALRVYRYMGLVFRV